MSNRGKRYEVITTERERQVVVCHNIEWGATHIRFTRDIEGTKEKWLTVAIPASLVIRVRELPFDDDEKEERFSGLSGDSFNPL